MFKRRRKTAAVIDKTFRTFTRPLFDTPMVENRRVKHSAILHAQMNCLTPLHKGFFDYFHSDSFRAALRFSLLALGRAWTLVGSRENSKPRKCSKSRRIPSVQCTLCWAHGCLETP